MTNDIQQQMQELKEANRKLLAENIDLRIQSLECVNKLLEGSGVR